MANLLLILQHLIYNSHFIETFYDQYQILFVKLTKTILCIGFKVAF